MASDRKPFARWLDVIFVAALALACLVLAVWILAGGCVWINASCP